MNAFSRRHPLVLLVYFLALLGITMFTRHPALLGMLLLGGICCNATLPAGRTGHLLFTLLAVLLTVTTLNPLFSRSGETPLFFVNDFAVTLEALCYGAMTALLLAATLIWCTIAATMLTQEKLLYLFGGVFPKSTLLLTAALRYIPLFQVQLTKISSAQRALGLYPSDHLTDRLGGSIRIFSVLLTWSLETAVDSADSMQARGYGLPYRSRYAYFRMTRQDWWLLIGCLASVALYVLCAAQGAMTATFYPCLSFAPITGWTVVGYVAVAVLAFFPFIDDRREAVLWHYYRSKV